MTLAASPGILTRIEVVEPPYCAPYHIPAIMIRPVIGPYFKVKGKKRDIVAVGPNPGRTPTTVPKRHPIKQANKLAGVMARVKPFIKCSKPEPNIRVLFYPSKPRGRSV
jgi:hypothetical protein